MDSLGWFVGGLIFGVLGGVAIGFALGVKSEVNTMLAMLKQFKSEGNDDKWLK